MRPHSRAGVFMFVMCCKGKRGKESLKRTKTRVWEGEKWLSVRVSTKKWGSGKGGNALRVGCFNWAPGSGTLRQHQRSDIHQTLLGNIDLCG